MLFRTSRLRFVLEIIGILGIAISVAAYLPQVIHLAREHCSAGVSSRAWTMWLVAGLLLGIVAVNGRDPVFMLLQFSNLASAAVILLLAHRYRGQACEGHTQLLPDLPWITNDELIDRASQDSFPASDPPPFWARDERLFR